MNKILLVRAGHGNELVDDFIGLGIVAVGWMQLGDLSSVSSSAGLEAMLCEAYPEQVTAAGRPHARYAEIITFAVEAKQGDLVATVDGKRRQLVVGTVTGPYAFMIAQPLKSGDELYRHTLPVTWAFAVARDKVGPHSFPETRLPGKSVYWLREATCNAIMSSNHLPLSSDFKTIRRPVAAVAPQPMSEAPAHSDGDTLAGWLARNEGRAAALPQAQLAERAASANPDPRKTQLMETVYIRDSFVVAYAKNLAAGRCDLCSQSAPFLSTTGEPYLESHHVHWLSRGGRDSVDNVVALCPNCHRKMHVRNEAQDRDALLKRIANRR